MDRIPLDEMTSDQLDALYAERDDYRADCQKWAGAVASAEKVRRSHAADADQYEAQLRNRITELTAEVARYRTAWQSARHRAACYLQSNQNFAASLENDHAAYLQMAAEITRLTAGQCTHALATKETP